MVKTLRIMSKSGNVLETEKEVDKTFEFIKKSVTEKQDFITGEGFFINLLNFDMMIIEDK